MRPSADLSSAVPFQMGAAQTAPLPSLRPHDSTRFAPFCFLLHDSARFAPLCFLLHDSVRSAPLCFLLHDSARSAPLLSFRSHDSARAPPLPFHLPHGCAQAAPFDFFASFQKRRPASPGDSRLVPARPLSAVARAGADMRRPLLLQEAFRIPCKMLPFVFPPFLIQAVLFPPATLTGRPTQLLCQTRPSRAALNRFPGIISIRRSARFRPNGLHLAPGSKIARAIRINVHSSPEIIPSVSAKRRRRRFRFRSAGIIRRRPSPEGFRTRHLILNAGDVFLPLYPH